MKGKPTSVMPESPDKSSVGPISSTLDAAEDEAPDSEPGPARVQLDSCDLQLLPVEAPAEPVLSPQSGQTIPAGSGPTSSSDVPIAQGGAVGGRPGPESSSPEIEVSVASDSDAALQAAVASALEAEAFPSESNRPRSSPPPPPSRRRSEPVPAPAPSEPPPSRRRSSSPGEPELEGLAEPPAGVSIRPLAASDRASMPPVELRRVLPARSIRSRSAAGAESGDRQSLVEPNRIIEVLGSSTPAFSDQLSDEVEDLDDSEAYELTDTPLPISLTDGVDVHFEEPPPEGSDEKDLGDSGDTLSEPSDPAANDPAPPAGPVEPLRVAPPKKKRRAVAFQAASNTRPPWWEELFSHDFLRAIPILLPRQLGREVDFIEAQLKVAAGGRILDLACGAGQHAVELASRGYEVVGFDASQAQLDWAGELALERMQTLQFINGDMRTLTFQETFDGISCWNTSFGYFEEEKNLEVAQRIFAALRPGGRLLLDVVNRDFVVAQQPGQTWFEGDGCVCIDDVTIDFITSRMRVKRTMMVTSGKNLETTYSLRLYGLHELGKLLHSVGFKVVQVSGRPETPGVFFGEASPRIIILAAKPSD